MKKKSIVLICILALCMSIFAGCSKASDDKKEDGQSTVTPEVTQEAEPTKEAENTEPTTEPAEKITMKVAALKGPTAMGLVNVIDQSEQGLTTNNYEMTVAGTADEITTGIIKGDFQIAAVPCNLASVLYGKSNGAIKVAGINTLGVLYIVETGDSIHSVEDLKGKTIYSTGKGTTPEFTLNYLLQSYGLDPQKDVTIEFKTEATEVAAMLEQSDNAIAMLPQPYVTTVMMKNDKIRIALDIAKEWEAVNTDSSVVTGVVIVNTKFLEENPDAVNAFLSEYEASVDYVNNNVEAAAELVEKYEIIKKPVAIKAIPNCNIVLIRGDEMKSKIGAYLKALYDQEPKAVGGTLPDDNFYYEP